MTDETTKEKKSWWKYIITFLGGIFTSIITFLCFWKKSGSSGDIKRGFNETQNKLDNINSTLTGATELIERTDDNNNKLKNTTQQLIDRNRECEEIIDRITKECK